MDVHVHLQLSLLLIELIGDCVDVLEIRAEHSMLIVFSDLQNESSTGSDFVNPRNLSSEDKIIDYLVRIEMENDFIGFLAEGQLHYVHRN